MEFVLLPHLAGVRLARGFERLAHLLAQRAEHGLAEADPFRGVRLLALVVVALRGVAHGQNVVREPRRLAPGGGESDVAAYLVVVLQHVHPHEAVGVRPDRVVDPREVDVDAVALVLDEMGHQEAHLEEREGVLPGEEKLVPILGTRRGVGVFWDELVRARQVGPAHRAHSTRQRRQKVQAARNLPAVQVARGGSAPYVHAKPASGPGDDLCHFGDEVCRNACLLRRVLEGEFRVFFFQLLDEVPEARLLIGVNRSHVFGPVEPFLDELRVELPGVEQVARDGEQDRALGAAVCGQPVVGLRRRVGEPGVDDDELRPARLRLDDALGRGVVVVARIQMAADEQNGVGVREIGRGPVRPVPEELADAGGGTAHVGVAVVAVHAPAGERLEHVAVLAGASDVVDDAVSPLRQNRLSNASGDVVERLVPAHALPFALAALAHAL